MLAAVQGIQHPHSSVDPLAASEQGDRPDEALLYQVLFSFFLRSLGIFQTKLPQALEGKKKVLLELRQDTVASPRPQPQQQQVQQVQVQEQLHQQVEQHQQQQVIYLLTSKSLYFCKTHASTKLTICKICKQYYLK